MSVPSSDEVETKGLRQSVVLQQSQPVDYFQIPTLCAAWTAVRHIWLLANGFGSPMFNQVIYPRPDSSMYMC